MRKMRLVDKLAYRQAGTQPRGRFLGGRRGNTNQEEKAVQEQQQEIEAQKQQIKVLQNTNAAMENRLQTVEARLKM